MGLVGRQFGNPRGLTGALVGRVMARGNAPFNRWVIDSVAEQVGKGPARIVELGCGPGVGLEQLLLVFPEAKVWGIDPSQVMIRQSQRHNRRAVEGGRLHLVQADASALDELAPIDLIVAVHLLYFWHQPEAELARVRAALQPGGTVAIGYRLRKDMPRVSQRQFSAEGHRLYDSDEEVVLLLREAGFRDLRCTIHDGSSGRLVSGAAGDPPLEPGGDGCGGAASL